MKIYKIKLAIQKILMLVFMTATMSFSFKSIAQPNYKKKAKVINLLDKNLSYWYKWIGVPHRTVKGLPNGTPTGDGMNGIPMGLNDVKEVFKMETLHGEKVLHVSGEIYGGLTTKTEYENYHLQLKYKWGTKKWEPRLKIAKDSGIMFHLTGTNEDAFWSVFMMGIECQISEGTSGALFLVPNKNFSLRPYADIRVGEGKKWNINSPLLLAGGSSRITNVDKSENFESDSTEWTTMDLYTIGNSAVYLVNGHVVNVLQNAGIQHPDKTLTPLTKGKIQLQSEGAEVFYKDVTIQSISDYPTEIKKAAGLEGAANWKLGIALYTFNNYSFPEQLALAKSTGTQYVEGFSFSKAGAALKDSLIMNLSPSGLNKLRLMVAESGLRMESMYITGGKTVDKWKKDFELAKNLKLKYVTAEPPINMLKVVDSLAGKYGIKVALHNHWKGTSQYWHPDSVIAALKNHPNLGACPDLGHYPKSGINPSEALEKLKGKIIGIHLKDIAEYNNPKLKDVLVGTGVIDYPAVFEELKRQNFVGNINIERDYQEKPNNLSSVNQVIKYYTQTLGLPAYKTSFVNFNIPFTHGAVFTFKDNVSEQEKKALFIALKDLENIRGVKNLAISKQISPKNKFEYAFSMDFDNMEIYTDYVNHPTHNAFVQKYWIKLIEDFMEIDTEKMVIGEATK